jgi:hypothetical protein
MPDAATSAADTAGAVRFEAVAAHMAAAVAAHTAAAVVAVDTAAAVAGVARVVAAIDKS